MCGYLCLVLNLLCGSWCPFWCCCHFLRELAAFLWFGLVFFVLLCVCQCLVSLPYNAVVGLWSVIVEFPRHTHLFWVWLNHLLVIVTFGFAYISFTSFLKFLCLCFWCHKMVYPPVKYFTDRSKAVLLLWIFYVFVLSCVCYVLCASVYMCFVVTCWERADLLALVCGVFCEFVTFPLVSWVKCGT